MAATASDPRIGLVLQERYRVEERIGAGGMGIVYLAERIGLGRRVAVKFLHPEIAAQPQFLMRFEREARAMSRLNHPHCVPVIDFGVVSGAPYIVMEYVTGESLTTLMARGPIAPRRAVQLMRQILAGLAHAHNDGIVHRDIKPDNVILADATGTGDHVRLFDFGLAKVTKRAGTASGLLGATAIGTPSYMSPEQAMGSTVDVRSDLYSCGVLLYQMLTGHKPFIGHDPLDVMRKHVEQPAPPLADHAPPGVRFPAELEAVVSSLLQKDPDRRFATAIDTSRALERVLELPAFEPTAVVESAKLRRDEARERPVPAAPPPLPRPPPLPPRPEPPRAAAPVEAAPRTKTGWGFGDYLFWFLVLLVLAAGAGGVWYLQRDVDQFKTPLSAPSP